MRTRTLTVTQVWVLCDLCFAGQDRTLLLPQRDEPQPRGQTCWQAVKSTLRFITPSGDERRTDRPLAGCRRWLASYITTACSERLSAATSPLLLLTRVPFLTQRQHQRTIQPDRVELTPTRFVSWHWDDNSFMLTACDRLVTSPPLQSCKFECISQKSCCYWWKCAGWVSTGLAFFYPHVAGSPLCFM